MKVEVEENETLIAIALMMLAWFLGLYIKHRLEQRYIAGVMKDVTHLVDLLREFGAVLPEKLTS